MLHPRRSAQYVLRCDLCETASLQSQCELCNVSLCKACVREHLSDSTKYHKVVPFVQRKSIPNYTKCPQHADKDCKHYCVTCDAPMCSTCVLFGKHKGHDISELSAITESLQNDLKELETRIYPLYEEMASNILTEKAEIDTNYAKLTTAADQQGEILHREITAIVNQRKYAIQEMKSAHLSTLDKNTEEITQKITELKQIIADLKSILKFNDFSLTSTYKSKNSKFRSLPPKVRVTLPGFSPGKINKDQLNEMFGCSSSLSINTEHDETMKSPEAAVSFPVKQMTSAEAVSSPPVKTMKSPKAISFPPVKPMKSAEAVSSPPVKTMKSPKAISSPPVKPMKSPGAVSSPPVKTMKSPETVSSPPVRSLKSPEAASSPPVKPMKSPKAISSPPVKPMKSPEAVSSPPVKPMKSPKVVSSPPVKPMKSPDAVPSPPVKPLKSPEAVSSPPVKPMNSPEAVSSPPFKPLLDDPRFTATTDTGYNKLYSVRCLNEDQVWTCGDNNIMKLLDVQGELLSSIQTKSGNTPTDVTVTREGYLVYTDPIDRTINIVKNNQTSTVITLQWWLPFHVCCTASGDLLVTMISADKQSKVVRYSGSTEKQTIQFDDQGRPLYSSDLYPKYIIENQNMDICVADNRATAVVVVNQSGKLRFRYTSNLSDIGRSFDPAGITTDSQSHILTADSGNGWIHILDQDGQFLRYIHNLHSPWGLCVDSRDNLFVVEQVTAKVKKIQYL